MKVYVLSGCEAYEMREVLGVYRSQADARAAAEYVHQESLGGFAYYEISVNTLGAAAELAQVVETLDLDVVDAA